MTVYCAFIMGQGGRATSPGVVRMALQAQAVGIAGEVFSYEDYQKVAARAEEHRHAGHKVAGLGYSLGVSALTYLQASIEFDLVLCIAASMFGQNYPIDKKRTKRSVLWRGPGPLSGAGGDLGFDVVHDVIAAHLTMDTVESVQSGVAAELASLK